MNAAEKCYKVIAASPFEVGLTKNGKGIRTWWAADFGGKLPSLSHPEIVRAIEREENDQDQGRRASDSQQPKP